MRSVFVVALFSAVFVLINSTADAGQKRAGEHVVVAPCQRPAVVHKHRHKPHWKPCGREAMKMFEHAREMKREAELDW